MKVRILTALTATATLWAGASAQEPSKLKLKPTLPPAAAKADDGDQVMNQSLADEVAKKLDGNGIMTGADVQIFTANGAVTLVGTVKGDRQKQEILDVVRYVPGVKQVRDGLKVQAVKQAQGVGPLATPAPSGMPPMPMPATGGPAAGPSGYGPDPVPVGPAGGPGGFEGSAPPLPPYAWPTYAPHNNVSRVAYPEAYPHNAFPFIGPFYPFPKVPLGWRKVTLEWEDGHWWLGRKQAPIDYWRVRFGN